jgi:nucleotide-binding universal stress UspA family protein
MRIMVGVDGSSQALVGARWVAQLPLDATDEVIIAAIAQRPVLLGGWGHVAAPGRGSLLDVAWDGVRQSANQAADEAATVLDDARCALRTTVRDGHPVQVLAELAETEDVDLIVVGPHGRGRLERLLLGSVSQGLLDAMPTSVLIAREQIPSIDRVVLATDGSPHSLAAARFLARLPLPGTVAIEVVAVIEERIGLAASEERTRAVEAVDCVLRILEESDRHGSPSIRTGDVRHEILAAVRDDHADLLVTGARGLGGFAGLVLGSVSRVLAKVAPCSVLVVPARRVVAQ